MTVLAAGPTFSRRAGSVPVPGLDPSRLFLIPADPETNNERVFVVNAAVKEVEWVAAPRPTPVGAA